MKYLAFFLVIAASSFADECIFCKQEVIDKQQVYQGDHWRILLDYAPVAKGHLLLVPIEPRLTRHELTKEEHDELYKIEKITHSIFQKRFGPDIEDLQYEKNGTTLQSVHHFHIHVIPVEKDANSMMGKMKLAWALFTPRDKLTDEELEREKRESIPAKELLKQQ